MVQLLNTVVSKIDGFTLVLFTVCLFIISVTVFQIIEMVTRRATERIPRKEELSDIICEIDDIESLSPDQKQQLIGTAIEAYYAGNQEEIEEAKEFFQGKV